MAFFAANSTGQFRSICWWIHICTLFCVVYQSNFNFDLIDAIDDSSMTKIQLSLSDDFDSGGPMHVGPLLNRFEWNIDNTFLRFTQFIYLKFFLLFFVVSSNHYRIIAKCSYETFFFFFYQDNKIYEPKWNWTLTGICEDLPKVRVYLAVERTNILSRLTFLRCVLYCLCFD